LTAEDLWGSEADLRYLNRMMVERLNLLAQARSTVQLAQFAQGDRVSFIANDGMEKHGTVLRLNKKTVSPASVKVVGT
jgi:hypothetical protein